jgi:L-serine dehydratase
LLNREYFSVGGGFVAEAHELQSPEQVSPAPDAEVPYPFTSSESLLAKCREHGMSISTLLLQNELQHRSQTEIETGIDELWMAMKESIEVGCRTRGLLPGGLKIPRRAPEIFRKLTANPELAIAADPLERMDWVTLFALAVNEQNAAGGRVVTAPTNGAAGVIPAVIGYYEKFQPGASPAGIRDFLLTAAAIGMLYKRNASLSAAEMGCQGEVGVACSMAAAGLAAVMGGSPNQIENAAEIGMEHNLGLTCDPIAGLVQVPCIERNTMGAVKAINAARLAVLYGDGMHCVPLDRVIETMRQTGVDMQSKYKETSLGGLAVNVINC